MTRLEQALGRVLGGAGLVEAPGWTSRGRGLGLVHSSTFHTIRTYGRNHKIIDNYLEGGQIILGDGTVGVGYVGLDDVELSLKTLVDAQMIRHIAGGGAAGFALTATR